MARQSPARPSRRAGRPTPIVTRAVVGCRTALLRSASPPSASLWPVRSPSPPAPRPRTAPQTRLTGTYGAIANPAQAPTTTKPAKRPSSAAKAFARRDAAGDQGARSAAVRRAIVKEQAAQRAEELAKSAEDVTEADRAAASEARQKTLDEANAASRESAAELVQESLRRTAAARVAAANARQAAETSESASTTTTTGTIPTGGRASSPVPGAVIGAHFGQYGMWSRYHTGLDFRASYGTPIRAVHARSRALRRQQGRLGRQPRRHQARRRPDDDVLAHVVDGGRMPARSSRPARSSATSGRPAGRSERTCISSCIRSASNMATSTRPSIPILGWPLTASKLTDLDCHGAK